MTMQERISRVDNPEVAEFRTRICGGHATEGGFQHISLPYWSEQPLCIVLVSVNTLFI